MSHVVPCIVLGAVQCQGQGNQKHSQGRLALPPLSHSPGTPTPIQQTVYPGAQGTEGIKANILLEKPERLGHNKQKFDEYL